ncbi:Calcium/calmodulin dependent protein kinase II, association-domain protein [Gammaproteobacteria bacterium]
MRTASVLLAVITLGLAVQAWASSEPESESAPVPVPVPTSSVIKQSCRKANEREIWAAFDRWNRSLQTGDPVKVVATNYAKGSVLLPTVSNMPRITVAEKEDYFQHFLEKKPVGKIDFRIIEFGCDHAVDAGIYTFTFTATGEKVRARYTFSYDWDGTQWLITSHHSSAMPEKD